MNNVDHIIKYLSGDMNQDEAGLFEEKLASDHVFKEQYEDVSAAYNLISDQLQKRDLDDFTKTLLEVMEKSGYKQALSNRRFRSWWYIPLALAGSIAILLTVIRYNPDGNRMFSRYYQPGEDPVLLAYNQSTRGPTESGILYFQQGQYAKTVEVMSELIEKDTTNQLALLYYLLASIETGMEDLAIEKLAPLDLKTDHHLGQSLYWYRALALIKLDRFEEANLFLLALIQQQGPYLSMARSLQKNLLK
jgi:hypothetical protein